MKVYPINEPIKSSAKQPSVKRSTVIRFWVRKQLQDSNGGWYRQMEAINWTKETLKKQRKQNKGCVVLNFGIR